MLTLTQLLQDSVDKVFEDDKSNLFTLKLLLKNYDDPLFELSDITVDKIKIEQLFSGNVTDDIQVNLNILPEDLLQLVKFQKSLYAELIIDYIDWESGELVLEELPEIYTFRVFIHDLENIAKRYNISALVNLDEDDIVLESTVSSIIDITIQLITDENYQINKASFVGMLSNITVEKAIKFVSVKMGIKRINMIPAHNNAIIHRLVVPPAVSSFKQFITYVQEKYGVYTEGISYYLTGGILYVYPQYFIDIVRPKKLRVLKVNPNTNMGLPNYHTDEEDIITIISNSDIVHQAMSNVIMENDGNSQVYSSADKVIDGQVKVLGDDVSIIDINRACTNNVNHGVASEAAIPKFKGDTINMFHQVSSLSGSNTEIILTGWSFSRLFLLTPGIPVEYIYDEEEITMMVTGILESTSTDIIKMEGTHGGHKAYNATTTLMLRLDVDTNKTELSTLI